MVIKVGRICLRNMSLSISNHILANAETAEKRLADLKAKVEEIKKFKIEEKIKELTQENSVLANKVQEAKNDLIKLEIHHGKKQYNIQSTPAALCNVGKDTLKIKENVDAFETIKEKKEKELKKKNKEKVNATPNNDTALIDVRKLDFRIGRIVEINKHPDADSLYVEKIDCGEEKPRIVVSGLVHHVPIEEMRDKLVMVLCNLKPVKMRGITSEGMVMCASSPDKVEVLIPPTAAVPGDRVHCEGYPQDPEVQLNPKKKIFETCAPDLKTNDEKIVCYKGNPLIVSGKGVVIAPSLKGVNVK